jgi:general secretion pathway protein A
MSISEEILSCNTLILRFLQYELGRGQTCVLTGKDGSGKSTIVHALSQLCECEVLLFTVTRRPNDEPLLLNIHSSQIQQPLTVSTFLSDKLPEALSTNQPTLIVIDDAQLISHRVGDLFAIWNQFSAHHQGHALLLVGKDFLQKNHEIRKSSATRVEMPKLKKCDYRELASNVQLPEGVIGPQFETSFLNRLQQASKGNLRLAKRILEQAHQICTAEQSASLSGRRQKIAMHSMGGRRSINRLSLMFLSLYLLMGCSLGWLFQSKVPWQLPIPAWMEKKVVVTAKADTPFVLEDQKMTEREGLARLFNVWGYEVSTQEDMGCAEGSRTWLSCTKGTASLSDMVEQQLPWLAELHLGKNILFAVVIRVGEQDVDLLINDTTWMVKKSWFEKNWKGEFTTFWKPAPDGNSGITSKSSPESITWLEAMLNKSLMLSGTPSGQWTPLLKEKITMFQNKNGLSADGKVGKTTLTRLWQGSGEAPRLLVEQPSVKGDK